MNKVDAVSTENSQIVNYAHADASDAGAMASLVSQLGTELSQLFLFTSPQADFKTVFQQASEAFPDTLISGCTTAGEIAEGYVEGSIVALGLPSGHFATERLVVEDIPTLDKSELISEAIRKRNKLAKEHPSFGNEFAFVMIDGLSMREDEVISALSLGMGACPIFGGSAGDGDRFDHTLIATNDQILQNAAIITFVRTDCEIKTFSIDHLIPADEKMVVTKADPKSRIVEEINAEPAAREYARILGKDPDQLSQFTFAANPVVVRIGGRHHVRSIQRVVDDDKLIFHSAIDEGLVLTLADAGDMVEHLNREFDDLADGKDLDCIMVCDCILRRIEATDKQKTRALSEIMKTYRAIGFSTYGEQFGSMHVNQTMTGVAIFKPDGTA